MAGCINASERIQICGHHSVCACERHIPAVSRLVRLALANVAVTPLSTLPSFPAQRGFCHGPKDNAGIGQGVRVVFPGDNVPTSCKTFLQTVVKPSGLECLGTRPANARFESRTFDVFVSSYLLRSEVLHAPRHLVGAGDEVFERELFIRDAGDVVGVLHAGRPAGSEVLPKVSFGGVLNDHI